MSWQHRGDLGRASGLQCFSFSVPREQGKAGSTSNTGGLRVQCHCHVCPPHAPPQNLLCGLKRACPTAPFLAQAAFWSTVNKDEKRGFGDSGFSYGSATFKFLQFCVTHIRCEPSCTRWRAGLKINPEHRCCVSLPLILVCFVTSSRPVEWGQEGEENFCFWGWIKSVPFHWMDTQCYIHFGTDSHVC